MMCLSSLINFFKRDMILIKKRRKGIRSLFWKEKKQLGKNIAGIIQHIKKK